MKKFFKILMVFALLGGAALSCTKDYSREIQDVQKQNQELQALVASLQNALNSTNATVSKLSATSDKHTADIAQIISTHAADIATLAGQDGILAAAIAELIEVEAADCEELAAAIAKVDEKLGKQIAELLVTHTKDIEDLKDIFDGKLDDLQTLLTGLLEDKAEELQAEIDALDGRVSVNEDDIAEINTTLGEIATTLETHKGLIDANREDIDKNIAAIAVAQSDIAKLLNKVEDLSARLTNIVAAPAMVTEVQTITIGDTARTIINMDFVVAPASAAKAIADKFGVDTNLKLTYTLYNALDRANQTKAAKYEYATAIEPYRVVSLKDGVISVSAVIGEAVVDLSEDKALYVTLTVAGKDEAGEFARVSDPVKPICDKGHDLLKELRWYDKATNKAVKENLGDIENIAKAAKTDKGKNEFSDTVFVQGQQLIIIAPDYDWKTLPKSNDDIVKGYELKWPVAQSQVYTLEEAAKLLDIPFEMIEPHFTAGTDKKAFEKTDYAPIEWKDITSTTESKDLEKLADSTVFVATGDTNSLKLGLKVALKGTEPEQAEYVGAFTQLSSNWIALGKYTIKDEKGKVSCNVNYLQRICKHVSEYEAADPLYANFAFNAGKVDDKRVAYKTDTTFSSVKWKSTTSIVRHGNADIYVVKDGKVTADKLEGATATVREMQAQSKFVYVTLKDVKFANDDQTLRIVWESSKYINEKKVVAEVYTDYIDLGVEAYHEAVSCTADADTTYLSHTTDNAIPTSLKVADIFKNDASWFVHKEEDAAQRAELENVWFKGHFTTGNPYAAKIVPTLTGKDIKKVYLTVNEKGNIVVNAPAKYFEDGKTYTITVNDSIDKVIKFNYTIKLTSKKVGAHVEVVPNGFVTEDGDSIYVSGQVVGYPGSYAYKINDINLSQYYRLVDTDKRNLGDTLQVNFDTKAKVNFVNDKKFGWTKSAVVPTEGVITEDAVISWGDYNKTEFDLTAVATVNGVKAGETLTSTVWTDKPVWVENATGEGSMKVDTDKSFNIFENFKICGIIAPEQNIISNLHFPGKSILAANSYNTPSYGFKPTKDGFMAPVVSDWKEWKCYIDDATEPYSFDQMKLLFADKDQPKWADRLVPVIPQAFVTEYNLHIKDHAAHVGATLRFEIPCTWEYAYGELPPFKVVYTINVTQ